MLEECENGSCGYCFPMEDLSMMMIKKICFFPAGAQAYTGTTHEADETGNCRFPKVETRKRKRSYETSTEGISCLFDHTAVHMFYFIYFGAFYDSPDTYNYNFLFYFHPQDRKRDYEVRKMKQDFDKQQTVQKRRTEEVNSHKVKQSKVHHPPNPRY